MAFIDLSKLKKNKPVIQPSVSTVSNNPIVTNTSLPTSSSTVPTMPSVMSPADDDQGLLRQVPTTIQPNKVFDTTGIKEFTGPTSMNTNDFNKSLNSDTSSNNLIQPNSLPKINNISTQGIQKELIDSTKKISNMADNTDTTSIPSMANVTPVSPISLNKPKNNSINNLNQTVGQVKNVVATVKKNNSTNLNSKNSGTMTMSELFTITEQRKASDLHLANGYPPIIRVDGKLVKLRGEVFTSKQLVMLFESIMTSKQKEKLKKDLDLDFSFTHSTGTRFRINIYHKKGTLAGAFRLIPSTVKTIAELNLPHILYDMLDIPQGLIILAGPTGSGKSTTIAAMIQEINMNMSKHILTIEDPIEYNFSNSGKSLVNQREIGNDVTSFKRGLREALREDPDVILVGEMRDFETIAMTITAAETGHLAFATLHTNSASQTVDRMIDVFPDAQQAQVRAQLANVLSAVISQRLVPVKSGGRKAVLEIMIATPAIKNAIREGKTYQIDNMIQTNAEIGMITMEKALLGLIRQGEITLEEAKSYTVKPDELVSLMKVN